MSTIDVRRAARLRTRRAPVQPVAGVCAGVVAGLVYLLLQVVLAGYLQAGDPWLPLERISAMLLGEDMVGLKGFDLSLAGIGLLVHLGISMVYGRVIDGVVRDATGLRAVLLGVVVGAVLYGVAIQLVAPLAFPWFAQSPPVITFADHLAFGVVAALAYAQLRRRWPPAATQG